AERDEAAAFARRAEARAWLTEADALDARLDDLERPAPSPALRARVLASAPRARKGGLIQPWIAGLGAALAGACAAGVVFGVYLVEPGIKAARDQAAIASAVNDLNRDGILAVTRGDDAG